MTLKEINAALGRARSALQVAHDRERLARARVAAGPATRLVKDAFYASIDARKLIEQRVAELEKEKPK